jgi:FkbM family methyltransferase
MTIDPAIQSSGNSARRAPRTGEAASQLKSVLRKMLHSTGFDLKRFRPGREEFLASRQIDTILDVGANVGQFGREVRSAGFTGSIVSFEPVKRAHERLLEMIKSDPSWIAYPVGLSNQRATSTIHTFKDTTFSSLHDMTNIGSTFGEDVAPAGEEQIALRRLDEFASEISGKRLFLKIDTQGHEKQVLEGAEGILDRIYGIQLELPLARLYEETWTMGEGITFMERLGFVATHFRPNNFQPQDQVAIMDVDCIFRRRNPLVD